MTFYARTWTLHFASTSMIFNLLSQGNIKITIFYHVLIFPFQFCSFIDRSQWISRYLDRADGQVSAWPPNLTLNIADPSLTFKLVWPEGTYALPMTKAGCPTDEGQQWARGTVFQDTEDWWNSNTWMKKIHMRVCMASRFLHDSIVSIWQNNFHNRVSRQQQGTSRQTLHYYIIECRGHLAKNTNTNTKDSHTYRATCSSPPFKC